MGKIESKKRNKLKILVVDDEPSMLQILSLRISGWGYDLITAVNGSEAINALINKKPDIIVLDYYLPGMDGIATLQKIREIDDKIAVIMFTAYPNTDALKWSEKLNVSAFIPKLSAYSDATSSLKAVIEMAVKRLD